MAKNIEGKIIAKDDKKKSHLRDKCPGIFKQKRSRARASESSPAPTRRDISGGHLGEHESRILHSERNVWCYGVSKKKKVDEF